MSGSLLGAGSMEKRDTISLGCPIKEQNTVGGVAPGAVQLEGPRDLKDLTD